MHISYFNTYKILVMISSTIFLLGCQVEKSNPRNSTTTPDSSGQEISADKNHLLRYEQRQGKHLYTKYCAVCHGIEGKGDGFNSYNLDPKPRNFTDTIYMSAFSDTHLLETIREGGRGVNKSPLMPSWEGRLKREEIEYVVLYIRRFAKFN